MPTIPAADLERLAADIFAARDVPRDDAEWIATLLVRANLRGHDSHGVIRVPQYCGTRMTPWESWPRRLARTSSVAIHSASSRGTSRAAKMSAASRSRSAAGMVGIGRYTTRRAAGRKGPAGLPTTASAGRPSRVD